MQINVYNTTRVKIKMCDEFYFFIKVLYHQMVVRGPHFRVGGLRSAVLNLVLTGPAQHNFVNCCLNHLIFGQYIEENVPFMTGRFANKRSNLRM